MSISYDLKRTLRELEAAEKRYEDAVVAALPPGKAVWYIHAAGHNKVEGTVICVNRGGKDTRVVISRTIEGLTYEKRYSINPKWIIAPKTELLGTPPVIPIYQKGEK